jgi:hypothetical protein
MNTLMTAMMLTLGLSAGAAQAARAGNDDGPGPYGNDGGYGSGMGPSCGAQLTCDPCADGTRSCRLIDGFGHTSEVYVEHCDATSPQGFPRPVAANCCPEVLCEPCAGGQTSCRVVSPMGNIGDVYVAHCVGTARPYQAHGPTTPPPDMGQMPQMCQPQILCEPCSGGRHVCRVVNGMGHVSDVYVEKCGH